MLSLDYARAEYVGQIMRPTINSASSTNSKRFNTANKVALQRM